MSKHTILLMAMVAGCATDLTTSTIDQPLCEPTDTGCQTLAQLRAHTDSSFDAAYPGVPHEQTNCTTNTCSKRFFVLQGAEKYECIVYWTMDCNNQGCNEMINYTCDVGPDLAPTPD